TLDDVFAIQDEISKSVASALQVKLLGVSAESAPAPTPTHNMDAYNAYLQGTQFLAGTGIEAYRAAEAMFEQAIELDPEFAAAHAGLARSWAELAQWGTLSWPQIIGDVREQVEKALALDPDLPLAWSMQGFIDYFQDPDKPDRAASEASLRRALELEPGNAFASEALTAVLNELGRRQEAVLILQKAIDRDPLSVNLRRRMANLQETLAEFDAAEANYRMATDLAPDDPAARMAYADFKWRRGELAESTLLTAPAVALDPLDPEAPFSMAISYLHLGDDQAAERWLAESLRLNPEAEVSRVGPALLAYQRGQDAQALEITRNSLDAFPGNRFNAEIIALIIVRDVSLAQGDVATAQRAIEGYRPGVTAVDFNSDIGRDDVFGRILALPVIAARDGRDLAIEVAEGLLQGLQMNRWGYSPVSAADIRAAIYAFLGDAQAAVESMRERQRLATKDLPWFWWERDSMYAPIRDEPVYQAFMAELNAEIAEQLHMLRASGQPEPPGQ
ncbi:MAG: tetratricopeptide repeat protein, partial [Gammaproteobacteria bacterium]